LPLLISGTHRAQIRPKRHRSFHLRLLAASYLAINAANNYHAAAITKGKVSIAMSTTTERQLLKWSSVAMLVLVTLTLNLPLRAQEINFDATTSVTFSQQTTPNNGPNNFLGGMAGNSANDIWTVGTTVPGPIGLHFDGTTWKSIPMALPTRANMNDVSVLKPNDVWAVGYIFSGARMTSVIQHFNGTKWSVVTSPHFLGGEELFAVKAIASNDVFAVGEINTNNHTAPLVEHFDGTTWSVIPGPSVPAGQTLSLHSIGATSHRDVWVAGFGGPVFFSLISHFDGQKFTNVAFPLAGANLGQIAAIAPNDAWVVGTKAAGAIGTATLTAHWNGLRWTVVPSPNASSSDTLGAVSAIASNDVWAAGCGNLCGADTGAGSLLVEHWNGSQWTINPTPSIGNGEIPASILALPSGDVFVSGTVSSNGIFAGTLVLHGKEAK